MGRTITATLVALALALVACGSDSDSSSTRDAAGFRSDYQAIFKLAREGHGDQACDKYMTARAKALADAQGTCGQILEEVAAEFDDADIKKMKITIRDNTATYRAPGRPDGKAVYVNGHWRIDVAD